MKTFAGATDPVVFAAATAEDRVLVTLDLDFSDIRRYPPGTHPGIIVLRLGRSDMDSVAAALFRLFKQFPETDIGGALIVVEDSRIRIRRLSP